MNLQKVLFGKRTESTLQANSKMRMSIKIKLKCLGGKSMSKLGNRRTAWKVQRGLLCELPGLGKAGAMERRPYPPGQHGMRKRKFSEYAARLREKQKILFHYGLREEQLRRFVRKAKAGRSTDWISTLIGLLESRLDNVIFRLGFAPSIPAARQLVRHGKVYVNGKRLNIPSAQVNPGDEISLSPAAYQGVIFQYSIRQPRLMLPDWLEHLPEGAHKKGKLRVRPDSDTIPFPFEGRLVAEFYSRV
jgi:small subunit ribosomal protein S4